MIGYEEEDDRPFDCYDSPPPKRAASSPAASSRPGNTPSRKTKPSPQPSPRSTSSPSSRLSKSRPWRVDVMLKKSKGVERSTVSWKQQMKERRQVFQWSGVTVPEDMDGHDEEEEESLFAGLSEDDASQISRGSERAVIGLRPSPSTTPRARDEMPGIIDLTAVPEPEDKKGSGSRFSFRRSSSAPAGSEEERTAAASTPTRPWRTASSNTREDISPQPKDEHEASKDPTSSSNHQQWTNPATSVVEDLETAMKSLESKSGSYDRSASPPAIANLHSALEEHGMPRVGGRRRLFEEDDDDDSDDGHSVCSVRSIASAHFPSQTERKQESQFETLRKAIIQSLEESFGDHSDEDPFEKYCIVAMGRADPNASGVKPPPKNEYFIAYRRMQRSRLASELKRSVALLPTQHFHVVEKSQEQWQTEEAELQAKREFDKTGNAMQLLVALSFSTSASTMDPEIPSTAQVSAEVSQPKGESILVETVTSMDDSMSVETSSKVHTPGSTTFMEPISDFPPKANVSPPRKSSPSECDDIVVETVTTLSMDQDMAELPRGNTNDETAVESDDAVKSSLQPSSISRQPDDDMIKKANSMPQEANKIPKAAPMSDSTIEDKTEPSMVNHVGEAQPSIPDLKKESLQVVDSLKELATGAPATNDAVNEASANAESKGSQEQPSSLPATPKSTNDSSDNVQSSPKKSKASKWKDRLAKRKGSSAGNDTEIAAASDKSQMSVECNTSTSSFEASPQNFSSPNTPLSPTAEASPLTAKGQRKSLKWKERLAKKKKGNSKSDANKEDETPVAAASDELPPLPELKKEADISNDRQSGAELNTDHPAEDQTEACKKENADSAVADEKKDDELTATVSNGPAPEMISGATNLTKNPAQETPGISNDLQNSFMAFDALLRQRQGGGEQFDGDGDDYSEYTIEESVLQDAAPPTMAQTLLKGAVKANKSFDSETEYEEITVDQSFMEYTVEESYAPTLPSSSPNSNDVTTTEKDPTPVHAATATLLNSRMFSTPKVAQEEPTITIQPQLSDDEMTQLTFDQSHAPSPPRPSVPVSIPKRPSMSSLPKNNSKSTIGCDGSMNSRSRRRSLQTSQRSSGSLARSQRSSSSKGSSSLSSEKQTKRVAELLRKDIWSGDVKIVKKAFDSIVREASKGPDHRAKIVQCGGVMGIVRAMETHSNVEDVQVSGCAALDKMAMDPDTQVVIGEMGGIAAILSAMQKFESSEDVHQLACAALANITRHRGATDEADGAVPLLCASMSRHPANMIVQSKSFCAIANLCMDNKYRLRELSEAGGMLAMTMALQKPWPSKTEKHEAISNLSILLRCMAEHEEGEEDDEGDFDGYGDYDEDELEEMMSVVSSIMEDEAMSEPEDEDEDFDSGVPVVNGVQDAHAVEAVPDTIGSSQRKSPTKKQAHEVGSNSTQPTAGSTSRDGDDENCVMS